jgi:predicted phage baseplate assembly protein
MTMTLPVPSLDDRHFQDLVDDAKRQVQRLCPEWTDHNVHDPGVTLIEVFAWMTEQLLYRLNRVPDLHYVRFLELIGVKLLPPTAARAPVTFWLSAPQPVVVRIATGTAVATVRTETDQAVQFTTVEDLSIIPCARLSLASTTDGGTIADHVADIDRGSGFACFAPVPNPGDALLVGLTEAVPRCALTLRLRCDIEGVGVDPDNPPLVWEAWDGEGWAACEVDRDTTGGLNRAGDVVLHVPRSHTVSVINTVRAGWVRARVVTPQPQQSAYTASPTIKAIEAFTIGGTIDAVNAEPVDDEALGESEGIAGQRFSCRRVPVVRGDAPLTLEVSGRTGWEPWTEVTSFADSRPDDPHFLLDAVTGEVRLGPEVRLADGTLRRYGRVPPKGVRLRLGRYHTGGGRHGNVAENEIRVLKSSIPFVSAVENRRPASGGVDGEDVGRAKVRGPIELRSRGRAVTAEDFEEIAREAAPEVARVRCVAAGAPGEAGAVRLLVVPAVAGSRGRLRFDELIPAETTLAAIATRLDARRLVGSRVVVEPPSYLGMTVVAKLRARSDARPAALREAALDALYGYFHPVTGGPDGEGWPFGRPAHIGDVFAVLQSLPATELVEDVRLYAADPKERVRGEATQRLVIDANALIFSFEHQVLVVTG